MEDRHLCKAKRTDNGEWVIGIGIPIIFEGIAYIMEDENTYIRAYYDGGDCVDFDMRAYKVDPSTICQCTGVPDRDKTIMYENDIVRDESGTRGIVRFGRYGDMKTDYGFYIEWDKRQPYWRNDIYYWNERIRVICSAIDNPELLEV